ncbi:hypothetical protein PROFUN_05195 [Planoprotostelium fungivorum]|uniref:Uncharacterized protein n=1 Tax=Planoprotostelium fungivorum TaxID=1890364 RepID=A0A2P6NRI0_9EUKA|nr:hypothetical protein PROFUN_05195 [Planoprotostelium fungivorum]
MWPDVSVLHVQLCILNRWGQPKSFTRLTAMDIDGDDMPSVESGPDSMLSADVWRTSLYQGETFASDQMSALVTNMKEITQYEFQLGAEKDKTGTGALRSLKQIVSICSSFTNGVATVWNHSDDPSIDENQIVKLLPPGGRLEEGSTAGIDFDPHHKDVVSKATSFISQLRQTLVSHMLGKRITIYKGDQVLCNIHTPQHPTRAKFLPTSGSSSLIAVTEYNQITIWDINSSTCIRRINSMSGPFYAMDCNDNFVGAVGASRTVQVYETRNWSLAGSWSNCLKFEVYSMHFSSESPEECYVSGLDASLSRGNWKKGKRTGTLQGDCRWIGMDKSKKGDWFLGLNESGNLYYVRHKQQ